MIIARKIFIALIVFTATLIGGCGESSGYKTITADDAVKIMQSEQNYLIVDVRTQEEYDKRHIPNAILLPIDDIKNGNVSALPDKNRTLFVYCWTGRRAENASKMLADMGYNNVYNFGGLVDWTGAVEGNEIEE